MNYWKTRNKVFADDYTLPLTLTGAMKSRLQSLLVGWLSLMPLRDNHGRAIFFCNPIMLNNTSPTNFDDQVRVWWYLIHVAMQDDIVRKNGFIIISNSKNTSLTNFDPKLVAAICTSGDRIFPIRWRQTHCCHTNPVFPLVAGMVKSILSKEQRETFVLHNGSCEEVLESFRAEGIPKECLPTSLGGSVVISPETFLRERVDIEGCFKSEEIDNPSVRSNASAEAMDPTAEIISQASMKSKHPRKTAKKKYKQLDHHGRQGDPRMNAALQAKLKDPDLPLLEALAAGGFVFEDVSETGVKSCEAKDKDGVTLYQRRNQLLRRLRKERLRKEMKF